MKIIQVLAVAAILSTGCGSSKPVTVYPVSGEVQFKESVRSGAEVRYRAFGIGENNQRAVIDAYKASLYTTLFTGSPDMPALVRSIQERTSHQTFFDALFSQESQWRQFIGSSDEGAIDADSRFVLENGDVKLAVMVTIRRDMIRRYMEDAKVIQPMQYGR